MKFSTKLIRFLRVAFRAAIYDDSMPHIPEMRHIEKTKDKKSELLFIEQAKNKELVEFIEIKWNKYRDVILEFFVPAEKQEAYERVKAKLKQE
jgi:hypothetical protein